jgi:hypothetical protein
MLAAPEVRAGLASDEGGHCVSAFSLIRRMKRPQISQINADFLTEERFLSLFS